MASSDSFTCKECSTENRSDRLFCSKCGAYLGTHDHQVDRFQPPPLSTHRSQTGRPVSKEREKQSHLLGILLLLVLLGAGTFMLVFIQSQIRQVRSPATTVRAVTTSTSATSTTDGATSTSLADSSTPATGASAQPPLVPSTAQASSTLDSDVDSYGVDNLSDGDLVTAWNEGANGDGTGQWVQFTFEEPVQLARIDIANGYQKDERRFRGNGRVRTMRIDFSSGQSQEIQLFDDTGYQQITPALDSEQTVTSVKMTILSVYPGDEWEDAALSEVKFIGSP